MGVFDAASVIDLAQGCVDLVHLERTLLGQLLTAFGADVGCLRLSRGAPSKAVTAAGHPAPPEASMGFALSSALDATTRERHAGELRAVLESACRDGVAVDVDVLGEAAVRSTRYFSEFVHPQGGRATLFAFPRLRGRIVGCLLLGRGNGPGRFLPRERDRLHALLPAIAVAGAATVAASS